MVKFEKDSSLSCIYYLGSGTILGSFISGCNMKATSTRICFIVVRVSDKIWPGRRSPYKIDHFRGIPKAFDAFFKVSTSSEHVRQNLVAVWSTPEKSAKMSYIIGYLDWFWDKHGQHDGIISGGTPIDMSDWLWTFFMRILWRNPNLMYPSGAFTLIHAVH